MQDTNVIIHASVVSQLKRKTKRRQRDTGRPHHELLDEVAREAGLPNWHHVTEAEKATAGLEKKHRTSLFILMDIKEGLDLVGEDFEESIEFFALHEQ